MINQCKAHFIYTMRHKWFVFLECCKLGIPIQGLLHDLSKFTPVEFFAYSFHFFNKDGSKRGIKDKTGSYNPMQTDNEQFKLAWFHHSSNNKHHWHYWVCVNENAEYIPMKMPKKYVLEMIADWRGAGRANNTPDVLAWYNNNKGKMLLHEETRREIETILFK